MFSCGAYKSFQLTETENPGPDDWHYPVEFSLCRPSIPSFDLESATVLSHNVNSIAYRRPMGMKNEPKNSAGMRISGLPLPPFLADNYKDVQI